MSRSLRLVLAPAVVVTFLLVSLAIGRALSANGAERAAVIDLIRRQARGDDGGIVRRLHGCSTRPACRSQVRAEVARLRRPGAVQVLRIDPTTRFALGGYEGTRRIAWKTDTSAPVVQCVHLRREGNVLTGTRFRLLDLTAPIDAESGC